MKPYIVSSLAEIAQGFRDAADGTSIGHLNASRVYVVPVAQIKAGDMQDLRKKVRASTLRTCATIIDQTEVRPGIREAMRMVVEARLGDYGDDMLTTQIIMQIRGWLNREMRSVELRKGIEK